MEYTINRYNLKKEFISTGLLTIVADGQTTHLTYEDSIIQVSVSEFYHPIMALERLRKNLESNYESIIGCTGCRIDSAYRATGGSGTYLIIHGESARERVGLFEPTNEILKLSTVEEHKMAYGQWLDSLNSRKYFFRIRQLLAKIFKLH